LGGKQNDTLSFLEQKQPRLAATTAINIYSTKHSYQINSRYPEKALVFSGQVYYLNNDNDLVSISNTHLSLFDLPISKDVNVTGFEVINDVCLYRLSGDSSINIFNYRTMTASKFDLRSEAASAFDYENQSDFIVNSKYYFSYLATPKPNGSVFYIDEFNPLSRSRSEVFKYPLLNQESISVVKTFKQHLVLATSGGRIIIVSLDNWNIIFDQIVFPHRINDLDWTGSNLAVAGDKQLAFYSIQNWQLRLLNTIRDTKHIYELVRFLSPSLAIFQRFQTDNAGNARNLKLFRIGTDQYIPEEIRIIF
jgi:hypothetical protein